MVLDVAAERNIYPPGEIFSTHRLMAREFRGFGCEVERVGTLTVVTRGDKSCFLLETETSFTSLLAYRVLKDKELAKVVLQRSGLSVPEGRVYKKNDKESAREWLRQIAPAVVKPVDGNRGRGVSVKVTAETFDAAWSAASEIASNRIVVERFIDNAREARYLIVDGRCVAVMMRLPPLVVGDGDSTVETLVARQNEIRRLNPNLRHCLIDLDAHRLNVLESQGLGPNSVPPAGTVVRIDWKSGLSTGGEPMDITAAAHPSMKLVAERVARAVPGLDVAGIDILARDHSLPATENDYAVIEANTRPGIGGHVYPMYGEPINVCRAIAESCLKRMGVIVPPPKAADDGRSPRSPVPGPAAWRGPELPPALPKSPTRQSDDVTIVVAGDTSLGDAYLRKQKDSSHLARLEAEPSSFFEALTPLISDRSRLLLNLETVLSSGVPYGPLDGIKNYLGWDDAERTADVLQKLGVDAVSLANNHSMDYGADGLLATIARLRAAKIAIVGAGVDCYAASNPLTWSCRDFNVHILAGFEEKRKYRDVYRFYAALGRPGVNSLAGSSETPTMASAVSRIRREDPSSLIIVFPHWGGSANYRWATAEMLETGSTYNAAGADLVVGHGAHMLQQIAATSSGTTAFSLGNFVFNSPGRYKRYDAPPYSLICRMRLRRSGASMEGSLEFYPIVSDNRDTGYRPRPVQEAEATEIYALLERKGQSGFREAFSLERNERGWHLANALAISPRLASIPSASDRMAPAHD